MSFLNHDLYVRRLIERCSTTPVDNRGPQKLEVRVLMQTRKARVKSDDRKSVGEEMNLSAV